MGFDDTGLCVPETHATLMLQQSQLLRGIRNAQMFPVGTPELDCPAWFSRLATDRGVFHYRPDRITAGEIRALSDEGRENEFLNLGPIGKPEIAERVLAGESLVCVTEHTPDGVEVRSAAGTDKTIGAQRDYFERTKERNNTITISDLPRVLAARMQGVH
jgi:hypothetical protein